MDWTEYQEGLLEEGYERLDTIKKSLQEVKS